MLTSVLFKLQNLRKNLNLEKETEDDETVLQNTYDPETGSPRYTKNKRRERELREKVNLNNNQNQDEITTSKRKSKRDLPCLPETKNITHHIQEDADASKADSSALNPEDAGSGKELKWKSKKGKSAESAAGSQVEDAEDHLLHEYQQQIKQEEEKSMKKTKAEKEVKSFLSQNITLNNDVGKNKKKKLQSVTTESDVGCVFLF